MDVLVEMAIDLACQLQEDERYLAVLRAQQAADADEELQRQIGEFNLKRMAINEEECKEDSVRDAEKLRQLNEEMRSVYASIMQNPHMVDYNAVKEPLDELSRRINLAIALALQGQDPHMAASESPCSGDCGSCSGCH